MFCHLFEDLAVTLVHLWVVVSKCESCRVYFNPFHANGLFRYPLKISENLTILWCFQRYRKRPVAWNGLMRVRLGFRIQSMACHISLRYFVDNAFWEKVCFRFLYFGYFIVNISKLSPCFGCSNFDELCFAIYFSLSVVRWFVNLSFMERMVL